MKRIVKLSIGTIIVLSIVQIFVSNWISTTGIELGKLNDQIEKYKHSNMLLKEALLVSTSFHTLSESAFALGLVERKSQLFLNDSASLALKQ